jgi:hypothetical protein
MFCIPEQHHMDSTTASAIKLVSITSLTCKCTACAEYCPQYYILVCSERMYN